MDNSRSSILFRHYAKTASIVAITTALVVLIGWFFNILSLKSVIPNAATMKFNTALSFLCAGISLWSLQNETGSIKERQIGQAFGIIVLLIGSLSLCEYIFGWNIGIDQLFVLDPDTPPAEFPGRMSPITAICFCLSSIALILLNTKTSQFFSLAVVTLSLLAVIGYLFDYQSLYQLAGYGTIALHTGLTFFILSLAILAARPTLGIMQLITSDLEGGKVLRFLLPTSVLATIFLGWMVRQGVHLGLLDSRNAEAILVILLFLVYAPLTYYYASKINRSEERAMHLNRLYATLSFVNQAIVHAKDHDTLFQDICDAVIRLGKFRLAWIGILETSTGKVTPARVEGEGKEIFQALNINLNVPPYKEGLLGEAFREGKIIASNDIQTDKRMKHWREESKRFGFHSAAAIPFHLRNEAHGVLNVYAEVTGFFQQTEELRLLEEISIDISFALEKLEAEKARSHLAAIVESSNDAIITKDLDGTITSWNLGAEEIFGYKAEEIIGQSILKLIPPDYLEEEERILTQVKQGQLVGHLETVRLKKDGTLVDVSITVSPVRDKNGALVGASKIARDITTRRLAEMRIKRQFNHLNALRLIDLAISSSFDLRVVLKIVLQQVISQLEVDASAILLFDPRTQRIEFAESIGFQSDALHRTQLKLGQGHAGLAMLERRTIHVPNLRNTNSKLAEALSMAKEEFDDYYVVPLLAKGEVKGVLEIYHRTLLRPDNEWLDFMEVLGGQAAIAIDNAQLFADIQQSNMELTIAYDVTIEGWSRAMDLRDRETEGHTQQVTKLTLELAERMGVSQDQLVHIRRGALLHDIGKLGVPDHILLKPDKLTEEEWEIMRQHPVYAFEMLQPIHHLRPALDIPYCHHEKWDGTGYPRGLKGEQIPFGACIFAVVDVWGALTSDRPYRPAWSREKALEYISEQSGQHFNPKVVDAFLKLLQDGVA